MNWLSQNVGLVLELTVAHLALAVPAILISVLVAVPIGRLTAGRPKLAGPLLGGIGVLYAIPSLPMFILIPSITGASLRSPVTAVAVLAIYGAAVLARSAADAFGAVPASARLSATALGYTSWRRFWGVELPLALPVIIAGVRVVAVSTVSLVTVAALIGISSLGTLFTDGFQRGIVAEVTTGLVLTVAIALIIDALLIGLGRVLAPWDRQRRAEAIR